MEEVALKGCELIVVVLVLDHDVLGRCVDVDFADNPLLIASDERFAKRVVWCFGRAWRWGLENEIVALKRAG
jgi:hypothetical protein